jgi:hypothetical protein
VIIRSNLQVGLPIFEIQNKGHFIRVGKKPGKFEKNHGNGKNWFLPEKIGKTGKIAFFQNTCLKSILNHWQINDGMF